MPDTELAKRIHELLAPVRRMQSVNALDTLKAVSLLEEAAAALSAARAEAMKEMEREARTWPIIGGLVANRIRALAAEQGGENE